MNQKGLLNTIAIIGVVILISIAGYFIEKQKMPSIDTKISINNNCRTIDVRFRSGVSYTQALAVLSKYNLTPQDNFYKPTIHAFTELSTQNLEVLANRIKQYSQVDKVNIREDLKLDGGLDIYFIPGTDRDTALKIELETGVPFAPNLYQFNTMAYVRVPIGSEEKVSNQLKSEQAIESTVFSMACSPS